MIHAQSRGTYGPPRVHAELRFRGVRVGRKRVERLMRATGVSGVLRRKRGRTTVAVPGVRVADDLVERDFTRPPRTCSGSPTSPTPTWEGWLYVAVVLDCFSRRVVGFALADHPRAELVVDALEQALARRRPAAGLVHHSDQGSQYVSLVFGQRCRQNGIALSMGSKGDCYDNAVCEAFFKTLKAELVDRRSWPSTHELRLAIFEYIEVFYNRRRRHSTLAYHTAEEYESTIRSDNGQREAA